MSSANCFFDEVRVTLILFEQTSALNDPYLQFVGTFVLLMVVFSVSDRRNSGLHPSLIPLAIFFVILGVGAAFGMQTGMSPPRPGLIASVAG
jgi:glycerol uptake facilitator-like aquaporin